MSLLPLLIGLVLRHGGESASAAPGAKKRGPKWPTPKSPPPSGTAFPPMPPMAPMAPMPAVPPESLAALHAESQTEDPKASAARNLYGYVRGSTPNWGFPGKPSRAIKEGQTGMGGVVPDGVYGPKTQARCTELLGLPCPARPNVKSMAANKARSVLQHGVPKLHLP
jgi:hypothetical protein